MPDRHAKLSPSSSHIWLHCPPSVRLSEKYGDQTSIYAEEGTQAHSLCEWELLGALGLIQPEDPRPDLKFYDQVMQDAADWYVEMVLEHLERIRQKDPAAEVFVEEHVDFSDFVPGGFGTSDAIVIGDDEMVVCDFKYGKGVEVTAEHNTQLMCYALGSYLLLSPIYEISKIVLVIYQPRISNYSSWELTADELLAWAENELRPKALMAEAGEGEFAAGDWCKFCRARSTCRERSRKNLELLQYDFKLPPELDDEEISDILAMTDDLEAWVKDIKEYALRSLLAGGTLEGWKVVEGKSNRRYIDEEKVAKAVTDAGYEPYEKRLLGITSMTSLLGKKQFNELLSGLVEKPQGKPVLVRADDKRPDYVGCKTDFMEVNDYE